LRKELALVDLDAGRVGQLANVNIDSPITLLDAHPVCVRLLTSHELRCQVLELIPRTGDPVDQL
jgi:hypothetical protein